MRTKHIPYNVKRI